MTLEDIRAEMAAVDEDPGYTRSLVILGIGVAMAVGVAVVSLVSRAPAVVPGMTFLALLMFGAVAYFVATFSSGMALADTFYISGADYSPWALPLFGVSGGAAIIVIVSGIMMAARNQSSTSSS
jgi:hypothetical protein